MPKNSGERAKNKEVNLDDFLWYLSGERRLSENTLSAYENDLKDWARSGVNLEAKTAPDTHTLAKAIEKFQQNKLQDKSIDRRKMALRSFAKYRSLQEESWQKILEFLPTFANKDHLPKALSVDEVIQLLECEEEGSVDELRNRALLELIYACGLRVSEAIHLKWPEVNEQKEVLRILGKGKKERLVPFSSRAAEHLDRYRTQLWPQYAEGAEKKNREYVFLSRRKKPLTRMGLWKIIKKRSLLAGLDDVFPHVLRHSFATHLIQGGADVRFVQALLGHSSLSTTETYLKIQDEDLEKLFTDFHPLR